MFLLSLFFLDLVFFEVQLIEAVFDSVLERVKSLQDILLKVSLGIKHFLGLCRFHMEVFQRSAATTPGVKHLLNGHGIFIK